MYLLNVSYIQPPANVEPHVPSHGAWVKQHLNEGTFLAAGPKKSGLGGIILTKSIRRSELQAILADDSYVKAEVAEYHVVEFDCKLVGPGLNALTTA